MSNKILVLGATGNIGSFLVRYLQEKGADFIGGVPAPETAKLEKMDVRGVALDLGDPASLGNAMEGIDSLFLLLPAEEPMLRWGENAVMAAQSRNVKFILRSSLIDAAPGSPYFLFDIHGRIDRMVRDSGIPYAIVHPNSFMQNFAVYYADAINSNDAFSFAQGDARVSYVDVRTIAAADAEILANPPAHRDREYTVTGPEALSNYDIAGILSGATGRTIRYVPVDEPRYEQHLRRTGFSDWDVAVSLSLDRHIRDGKQEIVTGDAGAVAGGPPIPFTRFARDYAQTWMKVAART